MNQQYDRYITAFSSGTDQGVEKLSSELGILSPRSVCSWLARASSGHVVVNVVFMLFPVCYIPNAPACFQLMSLR